MRNRTPACRGNPPRKFPTQGRGGNMERKKREVGAFYDANLTNKEKGEVSNSFITP